MIKTRTLHLHYRHAGDTVTTRSLTCDEPSRRFRPARSASGDFFRDHFCGERSPAGIKRSGGEGFDPAFASSRCVSLYVPARIHGTASRVPFRRLYGSAAFRLPRTKLVLRRVELQAPSRRRRLVRRCIVHVCPKAAREEARSLLSPKEARAAGKEHALAFSSPRLHSPRGWGLSVFDDAKALRVPRDEVRCGTEFRCVPSLVALQCRKRRAGPTARRRLPLSSGWQSASMSRKTLINDDMHCTRTQTSSRRGRGRTHSRRDRQIGEQSLRRIPSPRLWNDSASLISSLERRTNRVTKGTLQSTLNLIPWLY